MKYHLSMKDFDVLVYHNKNYWGTYNSEYLNIAIELRYIYLKPEGVRNTKWKYYISDVARFMNSKNYLYGRHTKMPKSSCYFLLDAQDNIKYMKAIKGFRASLRGETFKECEAMVKEVYKEDEIEKVHYDGLDVTVEEEVKVKLEVRKSILLVDTDKIDFSPCPPLPVKNLQHVLPILPQGRSTYKEMVMKDYNAGITFNRFFNGLGGQALSRHYTGVDNPVYKTRKINVEKVEVKTVIRPVMESYKNVRRIKAKKATQEKFKLKLKNKYEVLSNEKIIVAMAELKESNLFENGLCTKKKVKPPGERKPGVIKNNKPGYKPNKGALYKKVKLTREAATSKIMKLSLIDVHNQKSINENMANVYELVSLASPVAVLVAREGTCSLSKLIKLSKRIKVKLNNDFSSRGCMVAICCLLYELTGWFNDIYKHGKFRRNYYGSD